MDLWSRKHPKVFLYLSYLSIFVGIVGGAFIMIFMVWQLGFLVQNDIAGGGLVLPIETESGTEGAVPIFYVPFWYWLIGLFVLVIVHEFAHGVIAERFKVKIKSSGFAFLGIIVPILPAAFVEPDEKQLRKKPWWQQIAVFGAGSTSNMLFGILFFVIWIFAAIPFLSATTQVDQVSFSEVMDESTLAQYNISSGDLLAVENSTDIEGMFSRLGNLSVNETVQLTVNSSGDVRDINVTTFANSLDSTRGMVGLSGIAYGTSNTAGFEWLGEIPKHIEQVFFFLWFLNIQIGLINLLPIWIADGGQIAKTLLEKFFSEKTALTWYNLLSIFSLFLIIFTIWPDLLISLLGGLNLI